MPSRLVLGYGQEGDEVVVRVQGEVDLDTAPELERGLLSVVGAQGNSSILLDFEELAFIDSSGLNALATAQARAEELGVEISIENPSPMALKVLEITGLIHAFRIRRRD